MSSEAVTPQTPKRRALGKGIDVLFPGIAEGPRPREAGKNVLSVAIEDIEPNRGQPRKKFHDHTLAELAESIREQGLMQPILVRKRARGFEIIAGERRWRACQLAGLKTVEVIVKDLSDEDAFLWALVENIQREDLNPIEEAEAYRQLIQQKKLTQEQLAGAIGKDRSSVANALRLLKLPERVRKMVVDGALSMGHARALLALDDAEAMVKTAQEIVKRGLSVRQVEKLVRAQDGGGDEAEDPYTEVPGGAEAVRRETEALMRRYGTRVRFVVGGGKGKIEIDFSSMEELDRLVVLLKGHERM